VTWGQRITPDQLDADFAAALAQRTADVAALN